MNNPREEVDALEREFNRLVRIKYPEDNEVPGNPDASFKWGLGDGFILAFRGLMSQAFPKGSPYEFVRVALDE